MAEFLVVFWILFDAIKGIVKSTGLIPTTLREATKTAPNSMGFYRIYCNGSLKYIGKAEDGIRKRFVQFFFIFIKKQSYRNIYYKIQ